MAQFKNLLNRRPEHIKDKVGADSSICLLNGSDVYNAFYDHNCILMACNTRIKHVVPGIMRAAEELNAIVIFELAKSEGGVDGGYTGQTPEIYFNTIVEYADKLGFTMPFLIHGDHITVKDTSAQQFKEAQALIEEQLKVGYTSFAIDASHNKLDDNIPITIELAKPIVEAGLGLEAEVGEIAGMEGRLTTKDDALEFITALDKAGITTDLLATNNGSKHGNYDPNEEVHIDLERTGEIFEAIKPYKVAIAQHGITGTPLNIVGKFADYGIRKGNVGTNWQNIAHEEMPEKLYTKLKIWAEENGTNIKKATVVFKDEIDSIPQEYQDAIAYKSYESAREFIKGFRAENTAQILQQKLG